jgi:hypothetical protein
VSSERQAGRELDAQVAEQIFDLKAAPDGTGFRSPAVLQVLRAFTPGTSEIGRA